MRGEQQIESVMQPFNVIRCTAGVAGGEIREKELKVIRAERVQVRELGMRKGHLWIPTC